MNISLNAIRKDIVRSVQAAIEEDVGDGDITAQLIPEDKFDSAKVITREDCIICGTEWVNETYHQLDPEVSLNWSVSDGEKAKAGDTLVTLSGKSRALLTGERTALNFLQLLSGIATKSNTFADTLGQSHIRLLDTRKTIPGLRTAQKYAVNIGGCYNHRIGLFDAYLIKENHIAACGSIQSAITKARELNPGKTIEVEVETLEELKYALDCKADIVMLDNFSAEMLSDLQYIDKKDAKYELSGNMDLRDITQFKDYNIDYISFGALTKHARAIDLSFRII